MREQQGVPESYGLRVFPSHGPIGGVAVGFADHPQEGDQVNQETGERLFVAPEVAEELSEYALDIVDDRAADGVDVVKRLTLVRTTDDI